MLRTTCAGLAISFFLLADASAAKRPSKGCVFAVLAAAGITVGYLTPAIYHEATGQLTGDAHIGHGIHLDWERVLERFTRAERELFKNPRGHEVEIVKIIGNKLDNSWDEELGTQWSWFPSTRYASQYLPSQKAPLGVCRHQARIMQALLEKIGIRAEIWSGYDASLPAWHAWVELPDVGIAADPTLDEPLSIEAFRGDLQHIHRPNLREMASAAVLY